MKQTHLHVLPAASEEEIVIDRLKPARLEGKMVAFNLPKCLGRP